MEDQRRHPDIFTATEAAVYLHLAADQIRTIEAYRTKDMLRGFLIGKEYFYHREDLDKLIDVISQRKPTPLPLLRRPDGVGRRTTCTVGAKP